MFETGTDGTKSGFLWVLWVLGWQWFAGTVLLVVPAFVVLGRPAAIWTAGGVVACSFVVAWLSAEAARVLRDAAPRSRTAHIEPEGAPARPALVRH